jgi:hypothetical protein
VTIVTSFKAQGKMIVSKSTNQEKTFRVKVKSLTGFISLSSFAANGSHVWVALVTNKLTRVDGGL